MAELLNVQGKPFEQTPPQIDVLAFPAAERHDEPDLRAGLQELRCTVPLPLVVVLRDARAETNFFR